MQKDPFTYIDGLNDLAYVRSNPVNYYDTFGLKKGKSTCSEVNPPYDGPIIKAAPYDGPVIKPAPYDGPVIKPAPSEPSIPNNPDTWFPNINGEAGGCIAEGVGLCAFFRRGVDSNGNLYESFEFSPVAGVGGHGSIGAALGTNNPTYGFDTGFKWQATGELGGMAGANYTGSYSTMYNNSSHEIGANAFNVGATAGTNGHNFNVSGGGGMSATVGPYFSWTWKVNTK